MDNPTKRILYRISTPNPYEVDEERETADEMFALLAYNHGYLVEKDEIVEAFMTTGQKVTTTLTTDWRGR
jgi:hypothetical protein